MDKAEQVFTKYAFFALTPFDVKNKQELESGKGFAKEYANRFTGGLAGATVGAFGGAFLGSLGGVNGANIGAKAGAILGAVTGDVRSLRKTEREAHVQPTDLGKYIARSIPGGIAGRFVPSAKFVLAPFGDYMVSRRAFKYEDAAALPTNG